MTDAIHLRDKICQGRALEQVRLTRLDAKGRLMCGDTATKQAFLHLSMSGAARANPRTDRRSAPKFQFVQTYPENDNVANA